jgi:hypothetical protein
MSIDSSNAYPVQVSASMPKRFERIQVLLRIGIWFVLGWISQFGLSILFFAGPIITAVLIAQNGGAEFHKRHGENYKKVVRFLAQFQGYLLVGTDTIPSWDKPGPIQYECRFTGEPTIGSALLRFIMVIPQAIALAVVGFVAVMLAVVAAIMVLVNESVGKDIWKFQMGVVAWQARVLSYYLSLVEEYPPFSLALNELDETQEAGR